MKEFGIPHKIIDIRNNELLKKEIGSPKVIINTAIIQIPKITGITVRQARKTIESLGFVFGEIEYVDDIARDEAISITNDGIELKEGDFLKKTSIIDFKLGNGKQ